MPFKTWIAGLALLGAAACGDPTAIRATLSTRTDTLSAFSMTGTPLGFPSALKTVSVGLPLPQVVRATADSPFDVAFDLAGDGRVVLLPVRLVAPGAIGRRVGIQTSDSAFASLSRAPRSGYQYDSIAVTVDLGETVVIETTEGNYCFNDLAKTIFTKLVVDSVRASDRRIFFRTVTDPNCGFRSFLPGIPGS
jgi:hypothetical protein